MKIGPEKISDGDWIEVMLVGNDWSKSKTRAMVLETTSVHWSADEGYRINIVGGRNIKERVDGVMIRKHQPE